MCPLANYLEHNEGRVLTLSLRRADAPSGDTFHEVRGDVNEAREGHQFSNYQLFTGPICLSSGLSLSNTDRK